MQMRKNSCLQSWSNKDFAGDLRLYTRGNETTYTDSARMIQISDKEL